MSADASRPKAGRGGNQPLSSFAATLGLPDDFSAREGADDEAAVEEATRWLKVERPQKQNFWPGLCLAFVAQAEQTLRAAGVDSESDPLRVFTPEVSTNDRVVNTLNFRVGDQKIPLRPAFNRAADVIRVDMRRDHPSAAPHATQAWPSYKRLIGLIFRMSPAGRRRFAEYVWQTGVLDAAERRWATQVDRVVRPFERVLADFPTHGARPGGALFQALVFGYFSADSPGLTLESHKVNTGSGRVDMPGDVAGFRGGDLELAVEVKDYAITGASVEVVLVDFLEDLVEAPNTTAVVVADSIDDESRRALAKSNVISLSRAEMRDRVATWDLPKQQDAVRGALYYLGRVQKAPSLLSRLIVFLSENGLTGGIVGDSGETVPRE